MMLSGAATIGQLFISHTIKSFGALLFATVMTTRQFLSILLSCLLFAHPLTAGQWMGTVMVFGEFQTDGSSCRSFDVLLPTWLDWFTWCAANCTCGCGCGLALGVPRFATQCCTQTSVVLLWHAWQPFIGCCMFALLASSFFGLQLTVPCRALCLPFAVQVRFTTRA
jgi:hypothetical protein